MDSKMKKLLIIFGVVAIGLITIIGLGSLFLETSTKKLDYKELEIKLQESGKKYYESNPSLLPENDGESKNISASDLADLGHMKPIQEYLKDNVTCTGEAIVKNTNGKYYYTGRLDCGNDYVTSELYQKVIDDNPVVTNGNGLYHLTDGYVFRGENLNNYISFAGREWQIMKIDNENDIQLISSIKEEKQTVWDNRYNTNSKSTEGINTFDISRLKNTLNDLYESFDENIKEKIVPKELCIGTRAETETNNDGSIECANKSDKQYIGLIQVNEVLRASIEPTCQTIKDRQCQNYNYLTTNFSYWSITTSPEFTHKAYKVDGNVMIYLSSCSSQSNIRPVLYVSSDIMFDSGNGTKENPYVIK